MKILRALFGSRRDDGLDLAELVRRIDVSADELQGVSLDYHVFHVPKRRAGAGTRQLAAPNPHLKHIQRRLHHRLLARLRAHPCATGFERHHSIASNAAFHRAQATVLRLDIRDFFATTDGARIERYFRDIGWSRAVARLLTRLCTYENGLPQGAPTSPRLSNLVNLGMDAAIVSLTDRSGARYTRYADDMTISWSHRPSHGALGDMIHRIRDIVAQRGYQLHGRRKTHIRHACQRQLVTGLVVNQSVNLPRETRRRLRAIEHHLRTRGHASLTEEQLRGWQALDLMVRRAGES
ncbi:MAG: RNA-directed DNA polymerase [Phycisphaerales bacterium]|nr:RNA-directed DNA polymerase [Phycisphaerales bacterium]